MVELKSGFYLCHTFELNTRLSSFKDWIKRESLPIAPKVLRYKKIKLGSSQLFVNQMGFIIAFQELKKVSNFEEAIDFYHTKFDRPYNRLCKELHKYFGTNPICDSSFIVEYGSEKLSVEWQISRIPSEKLFLTTLIEALFIDELCRALERKSDLFLKESSLAEDRLLAEYAQSLFPLAYPSGFLIGTLEINKMEIFFDKWKLGERVASLHQRFTESVMNTALYNGHLEKNRQNILNMILAAIAFISLSQVSEPISIFFEYLQLSVSSDLLNNVFICIALFLLTFGFWRYVINPWSSIFYDNIKRKYLTKKIQDSNVSIPES